MGCGCNKGATNTAAAKTVAANRNASTLYEVVDGAEATARVKFRTRDKARADARAAANTGWRVRRAGQP